MKTMTEHNVMKRLPEITARKPQLRNNSWAKLLSEQKYDKYGENGDRMITALDVWCEPALLNLKETRKTGQGSVGKLPNYVERCEEEKVEKVDEMQMVGNKMRRKRLDNNEEEHGTTICTSNGSCSKEEANKTSTADFDEEKTDRDHLPPLRNGKINPLPKITNEKRNFPKNPKNQRESFSRKTSHAIDWQKIFNNAGGFRPYESRDLPTRGEINLLKYKTWNADEPVYCITKCAKYFGLDSNNGNAEKLMKKEPSSNLYTCPSPTHKLYPFQVSKRQKSFVPKESTSVSLMYLKNQSKQDNLCNSSVVPPATPVSSMITFSPIRWTPLPYMERRSALGELAELSIDIKTTDEGIYSPTESELDLQGIRYKTH